MTNEIRKFIKQVVDSEELQKRLQECKDDEEAFSVAQGVVAELDYKDFVNVMAKLSKGSNNDSGDLDDAELEEVTGGFIWDPTAVVVADIHN